MELVENKPATDYPPREEWKVTGFSYASDMMARAMRSDDAEAFMRFCEECGGVGCDVLIAGSVINYAALHGAKECVKAVGGDAGYPLEHWLERAENPRY